MELEGFKKRPLNDLPFRMRSQGARISRRQETVNLEVGLVPQYRRLVKRIQERDFVKLFCHALSQTELNRSA